MALDSVVATSSFLETLNQQDYTFAQMHARRLDAGKAWRGPIGLLQTYLYLNTAHDDPTQGSYSFEQRKEAGVKIYHLAFEYK